MSSTNSTESVHVLGERILVCELEPGMRSSGFGCSSLIAPWGCWENRGPALTSCWVTCFSLCQCSEYRQNPAATYSVRPKNSQESCPMNPPCVKMCLFLLEITAWLESRSDSHDATLRSIHGHIHEWVCKAAMSRLRGNHVQGYLHFVLWLKRNVHLIVLNIRLCWQKCACKKRSNS